MGVFHIFKIVQMVPNCAAHQILSLILGMVLSRVKLSVKQFGLWKKHFLIAINTLENFFLFSKRICYFFSFICHVRKAGEYYLEECWKEVIKIYFLLRNFPLESFVSQFIACCSWHMEKLWYFIRLYDNKWIYDAI